MSYDRLRGSGGIQWPCTPDQPDGTVRLYQDGHLYRALNPSGKAVLKAGEYLAPRRRTRPAGQAFGLKLDMDIDDGSGVLSALRQKGADLIGRHHDAGFVLLADLRRVYRKASGVSLDWEILAQSAQAAKNRDLLALAQRSHPQTLRQTRWLNAMLKASSAQVLVT